MAMADAVEAATAEEVGAEEGTATAAPAEGALAGVRSDLEEPAREVAEAMVEVGAKVAKPAKEEMAEEAEGVDTEVQECMVARAALAASTEPETWEVAVDAADIANKRT